MTIFFSFFQSNLAYNNHKLILHLQRRANMLTTKLENRICTFSCNNLKINSIFLVILGSFIITLGAQITLPLQPVPITLQTFAVLFVGMVLGSKLGAQAVLLYLLEGICGLPVFSNFSYGIMHFVGPTGGYLLGFIFAAYISGYLLENGWALKRSKTCLAAVIGTLTLFTFGYLVLACYLGFRNAYLFGIKPFYLIEIAKILAFTAITPLFWRRHD